MRTEQISMAEAAELMRVLTQLCSQNKRSVITTMNKDMSHTQPHIDSLTEK